MQNFLKLKECFFEIKMKNVSFIKNYVRENL